MNTISTNSTNPTNPIIHTKRNSLIWGLIMVAAGFLFFVQQLGMLVGLSGMIWTALFGIGAVAFLLFFLAHPRQTWWAAIPGFTLGGLATVTLLDQLNIRALDAITGSVFLGSIGLAFALIFLFNPDKWWALIPGGVMLTLSVVAYVSQIDTPIDEGSVLFVGLALTFAAIGLLPNENGQSRRWAFIPAAVLLVIGLLIGFSMDRYAQYLWPLVLIVVGMSIVYRSLMNKQSE